MRSEDRDSFDIGNAANFGRDGTLKGVSLIVMNRYLTVFASGIIIYIRSKVVTFSLQGWRLIC